MVVLFVIYVFFLMLFIVMIFYFSVSKVVSFNMICSEKESNVFFSFKYGLVDFLNSFLLWFDKLDCCMWLGVYCNNMGKVMEINFDMFVGFFYSELSGEISFFLFELKYLNCLDLSLNYFVFILMLSFLGLLESLSYLDFSLSGFMGLIFY